MFSTDIMEKFLLSSIRDCTRGCGLSSSVLATGESLVGGNWEKEERGEGGGGKGERGKRRERERGRERGREGGREGGGEGGREGGRGRGREREHMKKGDGEGVCERRKMERDA